MAYYVTPETLDQKSKEWQVAIAPYNTHKMELNVENSALLVIDMQRFFLDPKSHTFTEGGLAIIPRLQQLITAFREAERPVIYTAHVHHPDRIDVGIMGWWWEGMCVERTEEAKVHAALSPLPEEKVIYKHRYSAFYNTDLETILRCLKVEDLVLTGIMTNLCCESTARDAYFRDYRLFFLLDATGSINEDLHLASLKNLALGFAYVTETEEILEALGAKHHSRR